MRVVSIICAISCVVCAVVAYYLISVQAQAAAFYMSYAGIFAALWVGIRLDKKQPRPNYSNPAQHAKWYSKLSTIPGGEYVYIIRDIEITGHYKIGRTNNPARRINTFEVKLPFRTEIVNILTYPSCIFLESRLHELFADKRIHGEWFNLSDDDLKFISEYDTSQRSDGAGTGEAQS